MGICIYIWSLATESEVADTKGSTATAGAFPSASSRSLLLYLQALCAMRRSALACWVSVCRVVIARLMSVARLAGVRLCSVNGLSKSGGAGNGEGRTDGPGVYGGERECGSGVLKETGRSGLGAHQFGESKRLGVGLGD